AHADNTPSSASPANILDRPAGLLHPGFAVSAAFELVAVPCLRAVASRGFSVGDGADPGAAWPRRSGGEQLLGRRLLFSPLANPGKHTAALLGCGRGKTGPRRAVRAGTRVDAVRVAPCRT